MKYYCWNILKRKAKYNSEVAGWVENITENAEWRDKELTNVKKLRDMVLDGEIQTFIY